MPAFFIHGRYGRISAMISYIEGTIELKAEKFTVIRTSGGVGYKVFSPDDVLSKLPEKGSTARLWTHLYVREDALDLYGFLHFAELELFEMLISVSGIGPKGALGVLGIAPCDTIKKAIASGDTSYLTRVSGIGRKTAEKIVLELREKMAGKGVSGVEAPELRDEADALDALIQLGYSPREAREALARVPKEIQGAEKRLKEVLKMLGKK